jgi:hypothetical protein
MRVGVLVASLVLSTGSASAQAASRVETLDWLAGCWQRTSARAVIQEQWMRPAGGTMLGMSRTVHTAGARDSTTEYEHIRVFARDGKLVYGVIPSGQRYTEFTETELTDSSVSFGNPTHDFPQYVRYARRGADSLHARIHGTIQGKPRAVDFQYARAAC